MRAALILALALLAACLATAASAGAAGAFDGKRCSSYADLYRTIDADLSVWTGNGGNMSEKLLRSTVLHFTVAKLQKGIGFAIYDGALYIISTSPTLEIKRFGHHVMVWVVYLRVLQDLVQRYGKALPNVEMVMQSTDRPIMLRQEKRRNFPVLRFCKTPAHTDILVRTPTACCSAR